mgnify:FL=1
MLGASGNGSLGEVFVFTSNDGGHSPDDIAEMALNKVMSVSEDAPSFIRDQALAHRDRLKKVLVFYMNKMAQSERTTLGALLEKQGHADMAEIIRRL